MPLTTDPLHMDFKYMFSVKSRIVAHRIGETSEGYRVDIDYQVGKVTTDWDLYKKCWEALFPKYVTDKNPSDEEKKKRIDSLVFQESLPFNPKKDDPKFDWYGLEGQLVSGSDWLLIRRDGVAELNSRVTLQEQTVKDQGRSAGGALINTELATAADLWTPQGDPKSERRPAGSEVYDQWKASKRLESLRFTMATRFKLAQASQPWAGTAFNSTGSFWRFESLPRYQYIAEAEATVDGGLITGICFDVWRVPPTAPPPRMAPADSSSTAGV